MSHKENEEILDREMENTPENGEEAQNSVPDPDVCRALICPDCTTFKEAEEIRLRSLAEMDNFKKRLQKEKDEQMRYSTESVLADLLPTLDNLDLAIQYGSKDEACRNTLMGVEMTRKLLLDAIKKHGLEPVGKAGEPFDPEQHEAIGQEESELPANHVVTVMQKGYKLKERLLRPAKVVVSIA